MKITVRLFASYREKAGVGQIVIEAPEGATVGSLAQMAAMTLPGLPQPERIVVAVNNEYRDHDFALSDGDEAALIPPVSGGR